jgi:hypothetical protein
MPRSRNIKPGFFDNSKLGKLDSDVRLLFVGLWCLADREGVLEYDALEIRRFVFGYRSEITEESVNGYLSVLSLSDNDELILLKKYNNKSYIIITNFDDHQNPHHTEKKGKLPALKILMNQSDKMVNGDITVIHPLDNESNRGLFPTDSGFLIPDLLIPECGMSALSDFKNLKFEDEFLKVATEANLTHELGVASFEKWKIKRRNAPPKDLLGDFWIWCLNERKPASEPPAEKPLEGLDKEIQEIGDLNWRRRASKNNGNYKLTASQQKRLEDYEVKNGAVWWDNLRYWKEKQGTSP